jgi:hypothetical protein
MHARNLATSANHRVDSSFWSTTHGDGYHGDGDGDGYGYGFQRRLPQTCTHAALIILMPVVGPEAAKLSGARRIITKAIGTYRSTW